MDSWKTIVLILGGSILLVVAAAIGLTRVSGGEGAKKIAEEELLAGARWIEGKETAKVTVVEFSDLQCPACKAAQPVAERVRKMEGVRFVYRHFPLIQLHKNAWAAARAAEAARVMGKGEEMVRYLFERQTEWAEIDKVEERLALYAQSLGLDVVEFEKKMRAEETDRWVGEDASLGNRLKLSGTPTFFVNGEQVAVSFLETKVKQLLEK